MIAARLGFVARGIVYIVLGGLAAAAAIGSGGGTTDARGALGFLRDQPLGIALLWITGIGLFGYAAWQLIQAATNPSGHGAGKRLLTAIKGLTHAALALTAIQLARGQSGDGSAPGAGLLQQVVDHPIGRWIVIAAALGFAAYGVGHVVRAIRTELGEHLDLSHVSATGREAIIQISRFGIAARGIVFAIVGLLVARAAWLRANAEEQNTDDALNVLAGLPGGEIILGGVALGLIAYGLYSMINARYRRIEAV